MDEVAFRRITEELIANHRQEIDGERHYKLQDAALARGNVEEALDGKRPWSSVFSGKARKILANQLASNQYKNRAMSTLFAIHGQEVDALVRKLWREEDLDGAAGVLAGLVADYALKDELRSIRGIGSQAAVLSFFRLVKDPANYPVYRPGHVSKALRTFGLRPVSGATASEVLRSYYALLDELKEKFSASGLNLKDRLHVQGALWAVKEIATKKGEALTARVRQTPTGKARQDAHTQEPGASSVEIAASLPALSAWISHQGLYYPDSRVAHFLAALLTKPFVVLSGLSGTGKTRLAIEVGKCMGSVYVVPVKPDWTDTRGVLGYVNPLTGRYVPTPALEAMIEAIGSSDPVMLVLDEMNLAHVERYFADVLSTMESGEPIPLHDEDEVERQGIPKRLSWPRNLFLVGTVNADETTYPFSPKVLDRAFVIDMSDVDVRGYLQAKGGDHVEERPTLPVFASDRTWRSLLLDQSDLDFIRNLHTAMERSGRPFGYRTIDEALAFLAHARAFESYGLERHDALLVSKILPRLQGRRHELEPVLEALATVAGIELVESEDELDDERFPRTSTMLRNMYETLMTYGHLASMIG